ncbi:MAG: DoxX family protein [Thermodesulfobacteriota bacterium]
MWLFKTYSLWGQLFARIALGLIFISHGAQKIFGLFGGHGWSATVEGFEKTLGIPPIMAIITQFFGGVAALLGLFTRIAALGLAITIGDAITHAHFQNGFFLQMSCEGNCLHGIEYNLSLLALSLSLVFLGGGNFSMYKTILNM